MKKALPCMILMLALGCGPRLNVDQTVELGVGQSKPFTVDPIAKEQTINVSAKANSGEFSVYIYLEKNQKEADAAIAAGKVNDKVLEHKTKTTEADLKAVIPANETAVILLASTGKKAEVKLKLSN